MEKIWIIFNIFVCHIWLADDFYSFILKIRKENIIISHFLSYKFHLYSSLTAESIDAAISQQGQRW